LPVPEEPTAPGGLRSGLAIRPWPRHALKTVVAFTIPAPGQARWSPACDPRKRGAGPLDPNSQSLPLAPRGICGADRGVIQAEGAGGEKT